jgi:antitoxin VapB
LLPGENHDGARWRLLLRHDAGGRIILFDGRKELLVDLNIKNDEAHRLARELADLTGESMTAAVTEALRERLERTRRERSQDLVERLLAIGNECAAHLKEPWRSIDHGELLYDEHGLPK